MMGPGSEVEMSVHWITVYFAAQRAIRSAVNIYVPEGEVAFTFSFYGELNGLVDAVKAV
jgi:hypothetical protein